MPREQLTFFRLTSSVESGAYRLQDKEATLGIQICHNIKALTCSRDEFAGIVMSLKHRVHA